MQYMRRDVRYLLSSSLLLLTSFVLYFSYENIHIIWFCCNWLAMSNSCYNPFVYGLLNVSHTKRKMPGETNKVIKKIYL